MRNKFYKYFTKAEHAELFLDGKLFFRTLRYFSEYEDGDVRGDANEGTNLYRPVQGLELNMSDGRTLPMHGSDFRSSVVKGEIYIFCMSMSYSDKLAQEFKCAVCVEVRDKRQFLQVSTAVLKARGEQVFVGPVAYRSITEPPRHRWALPEIICMTKSPEFRRQFEYRIAFGKPEVFRPENVEVRLVPQGHRDESNSQHDESATIDVGSIRDLCFVRTI